MPTKAWLEENIEKLEQQLDDFKNENRKLDQELYKLRGEYSEMSVTKGRAVYALRAIAGLVIHDEAHPPRLYAWKWLKKHDLIALQVRLFLDEEEE